MSAPREELSLSCIKHDPSERKLKAPECLDFCMASGCIERAPVSKHLYPMQHREWLLGHDCEVEGTEYQQPTLRDLSSEMQEHNEKERASPDKAQALKRPDSGGKRVQRKARRVASQLAKGRRIEPLPDTPETGKAVGEKRVMEDKKPGVPKGVLAPPAVPLADGSPVNLNKFTRRGPGCQLNYSRGATTHDASIACTAHSIPILSQHIP